METESLKSEKNITKDNIDQDELDKRMLNGRNIFSTFRLRRVFFNNSKHNEELFRKSILAYNGSILLYFSPILYLIYYITQTI
jgi:hypothetical protein